MSFFATSERTIQDKVDKSRFGHNIRFLFFGTVICLRHFYFFFVQKNYSANPSLMPGRTRISISPKPRPGSASGRMPSAAVPTVSKTQ